MPLRPTTEETNMKAGETLRFDCPDCDAEFEVTYEPKASGNPKTARGIEPKAVTRCPFCGHEVNEEDAL
jgi:hypothetical protein